MKPDISAGAVLVLNPYDASGYSGPAILASRLFGELRQRHHTVAAFVPAPGVRTWADDVVAVGPRRGLGPGGQLWWSLAASFALLRRRARVEVVHVHGCYLFALVPALVAMLLGHRVILFPLLGGGDLQVNSRTGLIPGVNLLRRTVIARATAGLALSGEIADELATWGLGRQRIYRINNIVDVDRFRPPPPPDRRRQLRTVALVGRIGDRKGAKCVVRAVGILRDREVPCTALLVGPFDSDDYAQDLRELVSTLDLSTRVIMTGHLTSPDSVLQRDASLFVLPSRAEGFPGALCEAMACGLPSITSSAGAMGEILQHSGAGVIVGPDDPAGLADAIQSLLAHESDWAKRSHRARSFAVDNFAAASVARTYERIVFGNNEGRHE